MNEPSATVQVPVLIVGGGPVGLEQGEWTTDQAQPGAPAPEALLQGPHGPFHLTQCFGKDFVCLVFGDVPLPEAVAELPRQGVAVLDIPPEADSLGRRPAGALTQKGLA